MFLALVSAGPWTSNAKEMREDNPLNKPPSVFWCPDRPADQQIAATKEAGCVPLVDKDAYLKKQEQKKAARPGQPPQPSEEKELLKIQEIQNEASKFASRYRQFLACCATDVSSIDTIEELESDAEHILLSVQQKGLFNSSGFGTGAGGTGGPGDGSGSGGLGGGPGQAPKLGTFARQWTLSEIVGTIARARDDLGKLKDRLKALDRAIDKVDQLDYEQAGRAKRNVEEEREAIGREFRSKRPPASAKTGGEIGNSNLPARVGGDIEDTTLKNTYGADIGDTVSPYSSVQESLKPRRGTDIEDTNTPTRSGPATQNTTLPNSTGFGIGSSENPGGSSTTPSRVGPNVGDSNLNEQR